ncbi:MAG: hypothetical protein JOZ19_07650 [Rubrobacter sp.]|nr:hypothetical protein [Rubrobacter sp.]
MSGRRSRLRWLGVLKNKKIAVRTEPSGELYKAPNSLVLDLLFLAYCEDEEGDLILPLDLIEALERGETLHDVDSGRQLWPPEWYTDKP